MTGPALCTKEESGGQGRPRPHGSRVAGWDQTRDLTVPSSQPPRPQLSSASHLGNRNIPARAEGGTESACAPLKAIARLDRVDQETHLGHSLGLLSLIFKYPFDMRILSTISFLCEDSGEMDKTLRHYNYFK